MMLSDCNRNRALFDNPKKILALLCLFLSPVLKGIELEDQLYMAGIHDATWVFTGSGYSCELKHEIPQFGMARFKRIAGEQLQFLINSFQPVPESVEGMLSERSPVWEHNPPDTLQHPVEIKTGSVFYG